MDSAYDSIEIWAHSRISLGHKPIIDVNPRASVELTLKLEKKARRTLGLAAQIKDPAAILAA